MPKKQNYKYMQCARKMPPLYHTIPGEKFDIRKSRVVWWLVKQPEIMQKLFDVASSHKLIEYDVATKKWKGVNFIDDDD